MFHVSGGLCHRCARCGVEPQDGIGFTTKVGFDWNPKTVTFRDLGYGTHTLAFINIHNGSMSIFCHLHCATNWFTTVLPRDFKFQGEGFAPGFAHCSERRLYPGHSYVAPGSAAWPTGISAWHLLIFLDSNKNHGVYHK